MLPVWWHSFLYHNILHLRSSSSSSLILKLMITHIHINGDLKSLTYYHNHLWKPYFVRFNSFLIMIVQIFVDIYQVNLNRNQILNPHVNQKPKQRKKKPEFQIAVKLIRIFFMITAVNWWFGGDGCGGGDDGSARWWFFFL